MFSSISQLAQEITYLSGSYLRYSMYYLDLNIQTNCTHCKHLVLNRGFAIDKFSAVSLLSGIESDEEAKALKWKKGNILYYIWHRQSHC